jgi:hypothetical protein
MGWVPKSVHVSQLRRNPDGSVTGANDCWEACQVRAGRELGIFDVNGDPLTQIAEVAQVARGFPDEESNPPTSMPECRQALAHYNMNYRWTTSYQEALAMDASIILVNGIVLRPPQYPAGWFGGENYPDHFVLWLPYYDGQANWFNDPLAEDDCTYTLSSVAQAFSGAFLLDPFPGDIPRAPRVEFLQNAALNSRPTHDPKLKTVLTRAPKGGTGINWGKVEGLDGQMWERVQFEAISGYVPIEAVKDL